MLVALLVGCYLLLAIVGAFFADRLIFYPQPNSYHDDANIIKLHTRDGATISAVYLPNPAARYTVLFSHGNAEDIGDNREFFRMLHDAGFAVFAYDYEGYGTSTGTPSESAAYADIDAAYDYLTQTLHVPAERILDYGRSVGNGAAIDLASRRRVAGLIVQSGFTSAFRVLTHVRLLPFDKFDNVAKIRRVHCPVLVMHGRADNVIPFWHGERLFAAANEPKCSLWIDRASHNDFEMIAGELLWSALKGFEESVANAQSAEKSTGAVH